MIHPGHRAGRSLAARSSGERLNKQIKLQSGDMPRARRKGRVTGTSLLRSCAPLGVTREKPAAALCQRSAPSGRDRRLGVLQAGTIRLAMGRGHRSPRTSMGRDNRGQGWELPPQPLASRPPACPALPDSRHRGAQHRFPSRHTGQKGEGWEIRMKCTQTPRCGGAAWSGKPLLSHHAKTSAESPSLLPGDRGGRAQGLCQVLVCRERGDARGADEEGWKWGREKKTNNKPHETHQNSQARRA